MTAGNCEANQKFETKLLGCHFVYIFERYYLGGVSECQAWLPSPSPLGEVEVTEETKTFLSFTLTPRLPRMADTEDSSCPPPRATLHGDWIVFDDYKPTLKLIARNLSSLEKKYCKEKKEDFTDGGSVSIKQTGSCLQLSCIEDE